MRAKKFGAIRALETFFRTCVSEKRLFVNNRRGRYLSVVREFANGKKVSEIFVVTELVANLDEMKIDKRVILRTPRYADAWDLVKDPEFELKRKAM